MQDLIKNDQIKIKILKVISENNKITPSRLASVLKFKYETIKKSLNFFEELGLVRREAINHGKKDYLYYELTALGKEVSKKC